jgi:DNA-binding CsgD family transcriptional regulator
MPLLDRTALGGSNSSPQQRYWLLQDIQCLLERAALREPMVVGLDDLQWADGGTLAALRGLSGRLAALPIGWVLAFRAGDGNWDLDRTVTDLRRHGADQTTLGGLDLTAVADVATDIFGAPPDPALLQLAEGAQGNPFFLIELFSGLREDGLVEVDAGRATLVEARLPRRVRDTMRRRLGRMSSTARNMAAVAACMGRRFTIAELATVLDESASSLLGAVDELLRSGLFAEAGDALCYSHDLNRQAVRASQPGSAVHALDRQVASALLASGALPVEVAVQLASSAAPGDEVAVTTLMKACDALAGANPGQAADLARRALSLAPERHPLRGALVARVAVLLHAAARSDEAKAFADSALREVLPTDQEAEVRLSIASLFSISPEERADSCRRGLALAGLPPVLRARLLAQLFYNLVVAVRPGQAQQILAELREAVELTGDGVARFTMQLGEAAQSYTFDRFATALALVDAALLTGVDTGEDARLRLARQFRCGILAVMDRYDEAMAAAAEGIRSAQQAGQARALQLFETGRARQLLQLGRLGDAAAALEGRFNPDDAHLFVSVLDADGVVVLGRVALHTGDHRQTEVTSAIAREMLKAGVPGVERHAAWLLALQTEARGDPVGALSWLSGLGEKERLAIFPLFPLDPTDDAQLVRIAVAGGDRELAESTTAGAERRAQMNPDVPAIVASAAHARGLLSRDSNLLAHAVTVLEAGPRRLALASALEDLAVVDAQAGRTDRAIPVFGRALAIYADCGARWDDARVRRRLRRLGVRRRLTSERRPSHGWAAMTDSELSVVRLAAHGLTNREVAERLYVSPHTVSGHLRHAFEKLGINSRVALARIAAEQTK